MPSKKWQLLGSSGGKALECRYGYSTPQEQAVGVPKDGSGRLGGPRGPGGRWIRAISSKVQLVTGYHPKQCPRLTPKMVLTLGGPDLGGCRWG
eukprot:gene20379-biopygen11593